MSTPLLSIPLLEWMFTYTSKRWPYSVRSHYAGCWRHSTVATYTFGAAPSSTRACLRNADADLLHDDRGLPMAKVCGFGHLCSGESIAFTSYFFLLMVRILHLYIASDTSLPTAPAEPLSSSQKLLLQGQQPVPKPPHSFTLAPQQPQPVPQSPPFFQPATQPTTSVPQPTPQPTRSSSWTDEVATEQSGWSIPETAVPNWAYSGRILGPRPLSQPLVYPLSVMPTPASQPTNIRLQRLGIPTVPPSRPQPAFQQPPPFDRPTSTHN